MHQTRRRRQRVFPPSEVRVRHRAEAPREVPEPRVAPSLLGDGDARARGVPRGDPIALAAPAEGDEEKRGAGPRGRRRPRERELLFPALRQGASSVGGGAELRRLPRGPCGDRALTRHLRRWFTTNLRLVSVPVRQPRRERALEVEHPLRRVEQIAALALGAEHRRRRHQRGGIHDGLLRAVGEGAAVRSHRVTRRLQPPGPDRHETQLDAGDEREGLPGDVAGLLGNVLVLRELFPVGHHVADAGGHGADGLEIVNLHGPRVVTGHDARV